MADPGPIRPADALYPNRRTDIHANKCVFARHPFENGCKGDGTATSFRDTLSRKEYGISGMCQACQDDIFGTEEEA
jgi:uncharacterized CHY-type Zn-finger protein